MQFKVCLQTYGRLFKHVGYRSKKLKSYPQSSKREVCEGDSGPVDCATDQRSWQHTEGNMPLRFDIRQKLAARSDRVKSVDLHPTEPWMLASLFNGLIVVWNQHTQAMVKTFEGFKVAVRTAKFIARKHWIVAGGDDMMIRVFNYNTLGQVHMFEAHHDYIRCIAVHPTQPYILTCSDDMLIKLWDWEEKWSCVQVFEGHCHYVMDIVFNPKDNNQFASASLDRSVKVWQLGSERPNFTLKAHEKGVNCVRYYSGGDKPYLITGGDDHLVKIWDYQNKTCIQTLEGHGNNINCASYHPQLPIILTGSDDGTIRVWHSNTYRLENTLNYNMDRVWCMCTKPLSNIVALGFDDGSMVIQLGREEPAMSMDSSGKVLWARGCMVQQANLRTIGDVDVRDGEKLLLGVKDMGSSEIYPQTMQHSPNGRFVALCGDGEYIIYTAMALRNKSFGSAQEFVWAHDSSQYAIIEGNTLVKIFKNFKQTSSVKPDFKPEGIFGGFLLGVKSCSGLVFYDWECAELIRRIDIQPKHIFWSDSGELVCIATEESFFVLRYLPEVVASAKESKTEMTQDGLEAAFEVLEEVPEGVRTGLWVGDCFIYTSARNRLNYYVGGEIVTVADLDRTMYLLGYIPKDDRLYLGDKELNVVSYFLVLSVLEYQTAIMRKDFSTADKVLPTIPQEQRMRVAYFLEEQGFKQQALAVSTDPEHRFELALQLGDIQTAHQLTSEAKSEQKWRKLAKLATTKCQFSVAQECLLQAQDYGGLLLLATASGSGHIMENLAEGAERNEKTNVAFLTYFLQGRLEKCLDLLIKTDRLPEAAFLARTYLPSHVSRVVKLWKESLAKLNPKAAGALADPTMYSNLFPGLQQALVAEQYLKEATLRVRPAADYPLATPNEERNVLKESAEFVAIETKQPKAPSIENTVAEEQISSSAALVAPPEEPIILASGDSDGPAQAEPFIELVLDHPLDLPGEQTQIMEQAVAQEQEEEKPQDKQECSAPLGAVLRASSPDRAPSEGITATDPGGDLREEEDEEDELVDESVPPGDGGLFTGSDVTEIVETRESPETEETLVCPDLTTDVAKYAADRSVLQETGTDVISKAASLIIKTEEDEISLTDEQVSDKSPLVAPLEEPIFSVTTASPASSEPAEVQTFTELTMDPLQETTQVLESAVKLEQEKLAHATGPADNQELAAPLGTELSVSCPDRPPSEANTFTNPGDALDLAEEEDMEAKLGDESVPPCDGALFTNPDVTEIVETRESPETEETLVCPDLTSDEAKSAADRSVLQETGTDVISKAALLIIKTEEDEISVTDKQVSDKSPLVAPLEEPIFSVTTASPASSEPAEVQTFTELTMDPLQETSQVMESAVKLEQEKLAHATGPGDNQELATPPGTELTVSCPDRPPSEANTFTNPGDALDLAEEEDMEAKLGDESVPPFDSTLSAASEVTDTAEEKPRELPGVEDTLVSADLTSDVAEIDAAAHKEMGSDVISLGASFTVKTAKDETCVTDGQVSDTSPLVAPLEANQKHIFTKSTTGPVLSGSDPDQTFTDLTLDPLLCPSESRTAALAPALAQGQKTQTTGLIGESQEVGTSGAESWVDFTDTAPLEEKMSGQDTQLEGGDDPAENQETELDEAVVPADDPEADTSETSEMSMERPSEVSTPEEIFDDLDWAAGAESTASEEMSTCKKLGADIEDLLSTDEVNVTEELVKTVGELSDNAATPVPGVPALVATSIELVLDPFKEGTQVLNPAVAQGQKEETLATALLPAEKKLRHNQELGAPPEADPRFSFTDIAPSEGTTDTEPGATGDSEEKDYVDKEIDVEDLDDLELDYLDLEDIDASEINLDEEFLSD